MGKIEIEDRTKPTKEQYIKALTGEFIQLAGYSSSAFKLTLKDISISLLSAGETALNLAKEVNQVSDEESIEVRNLAVKYSEERKEQLEKSGTMDKIKFIWEQYNKEKK